MSGFGMMEGAYFVGRQELLAWLNDLLQLDYTKVEQACNAAAITQLMDILYPGQVALSKINFNALHEYERVNNFKVLQNVFDKQKIDRFVDVQKLIKGKYQDNLEFLQWAKRFYELNIPQDAENYDAKARRAQAKCVYSGDVKTGGNSRRAGAGAGTSIQARTTGTATAGTKVSSPAARRVPATVNAVARSAAAPAARASTTSPATKIAPSTTRAAAGVGTRATANKENARSTTNTRSPGVASTSSKASQASPGVSTGTSSRATLDSGGREDVPPANSAFMKQLTAQVAELELTRDSLEKERDFYFGRLRDIEVFLQGQDQENDVVQQVLNILYNPAGADEQVLEE